MLACCFEPMKKPYYPYDPFNPFPPEDPILYPRKITIDC